MYHTCHPTKLKAYTVLIIDVIVLGVIMLL